jgi:hypothetical protein
MNMTEHDEEVIDKTVERTLTRMGFDVSDPIACQADMHFLRSARTITGKAGTRAIMVLIGVMTVAAVGGALAAVARAAAKAISG